MASPYNDPSLISTWSHCAWFASGCITVLISLAKSVTTAFNSRTWLELILSYMVGYVLADLFSGIYHWAIDNYGCAKTPIFGNQIRLFQLHHETPWAIARQQMAKSLHVTARVLTFMVLPIVLLCSDPVLLGFVGVFAGFILFTLQIHAWAHCAKDKLPPLVVALQDCRIIVKSSKHAAHHRPPYNSNYCIVSGMWDMLLDKSKFFVALEKIFFFMLGVPPRSWTEPNSESTQGTEFQK
ncbi:Fatty acid desaturase 4 [Forsythia ovata]|uniref:Fatty acid desaturase 4 n=1 Tax=Forsythia ovata TaxID=205694 RepID=A0ABD1QBI6_9LAMI